MGKSGYGFILVMDGYGYMVIWLYGYWYGYELLWLWFMGMVICLVMDGYGKLVWYIFSVQGVQGAL